MSLVLRGVDYGPVQCASGAMGWFGEGYWYHRWVPGLNWKGCSLVSKTTTLDAREGNMPLDDKGQAKELFPSCVVVKPRKGVVLNSVGLSGPGLRSLLETGEWQKQAEPFFLSVMSVAPDRALAYPTEERHPSEDRLTEHAQIALMLEEFLQVGFQAPFALQVNLSCPNTSHDPAEIAKEAWATLGVYHNLRTAFNIPIVPKFNVLYPIEAVAELQRRCDGICISNTIPWGQLPADINWLGLFPRPDDGLSYEAEPHYYNIPDSPLKHLGGGGLSGRPLLPLVEEWVKAARGRGVTLPINAGGGILRPRDVDVLVKAGADSVFLGSIAILRGWRVKSTIRRAHRLMG